MTQLKMEQFASKKEQKYSKIASNNKDTYM